MANATILESVEGWVNAEITLYDDGEIEIVLDETSGQRCGLSFYCTVNDFENGLKKAKVELDDQRKSSVKICPNCGTKNYDLCIICQGCRYKFKATDR
jgi:hypothetical protein